MLLYVYTKLFIFRNPGAQRNHEEGNATTLNESFTQFIAENFPSYTCIFQLVIPRFTRLDLSAYKNAVMLFRLGKVKLMYYFHFYIYLGMVAPISLAVCTASS